MPKANPATPLTVICAGISRINKDSILTRLRSYAMKEEQITDVPKVVMPIFPADKLPMLTFLPNADSGAHRQALLDSYSGVIRAVNVARKDPRTKCIFIPMHMTFMYYDRIFSPISWLPERPLEVAAPSMLVDFLRQLEPDYIVNFIDDCQYIKRRVKHGPGRLKFHLSDILKWREVETLVADLAANYAIPFDKRRENSREYPFERSPIFAIRQRRDCLYKYLFRPDVPRIYTSFLISEVRREGDPKRRRLLEAQVKNLVDGLSARFAVFNPLSIDELPLRALWESARDGRAKRVKFARSMRWPLSGAAILTGERITDVDAIETNELADLFSATDQDGRTIVERQIEMRDYRLIDQSDCVVVYRPTNKSDTSTGNWGGGCLGEFQYATASLRSRPGMHVYVVWDKRDKPLGEIVNEDEGSIFRGDQSRIRVLKFDDLDIQSNQRRAIEKLVSEISNASSEMTRYRVNGILAPAL